MSQKTRIPDEITVPALKIAEEKCEFQTVGTEDMKEITSAELEVVPISKDAREKHRFGAQRFC